MAPNCWTCASVLALYTLLGGAAPAAENLIRYEDASASLPAKSGRGLSMNAKAADLDGDGDLDIFVAMEFEPNRLLLGNGQGAFTDASAQLPRTARDSEEAAIADFDGDGDLDIAVANEDDLLPELYLNDGRANFHDESARIAARVKANSVIALDSAKSGHSDLFFGGDKVSVLFVNDGKAKFRDESIKRLPPLAFANQDIAAGDIDGDGDIDLVAGNEDRNLILLNDGRGTYSAAPREALPRASSPEETRDVALLDAEGDGDLDIFFANVAIWNPRALAQNRLLLNDGRGRFRDAGAAGLPQRIESTMAAAILDLNGDGLSDLVTVGFGGLLGQNLPGRVRALINRKGRFEDMTDQVMPEGFTATGFDILSTDFNGDGISDLFVATRNGPDKLLLGRH